MCLKDFCKLTSQVLDTWVPYKTRGLKTRFLLVELDTTMPHRSWVLKTRILQSKTESFKTQFSSRNTIMPHRSRVYKTRNLFKIYLDLESYRLDFCWAKFYKTQTRINKSLNTLSPITLTFLTPLVSILTPYCLSLSLLLPFNKFTSQVRVWIWLSLQLGIICCWVWVKESDYLFGR